MKELIFSITFFDKVSFLYIIAIIKNYASSGPHKIGETFLSNIYKVTPSPTSPKRKKKYKKNKIVNKFRKFLYILHSAPTKFSSTICKIVKLYIYILHISI